MTNEQLLGIIIVIIFLTLCFALWMFYIAFRRK